MVVGDDEDVDEDEEEQAGILPVLKPCFNFYFMFPLLVNGRRIHIILWSWNCLFSVILDGFSYGNESR